MKTSQDGLDLIKQHEGCKLEAYLCPAKVWTIGVGHTKGVKEGDVITEDQADEFLREDVKDSEQCVKNSASAVLQQHQFDALVSLVFNIGCGNFRKSSLLRYLNNGHSHLVPDEFGKWVYGGGKVLPGLVKRREAERRLFLGTT